ncbi:MAG: hypothetical protein LBT79_07985 [Elusimicrobiota bacterium]|jgi:hypothetical protein|nr:hypothetical protein [Elusimicrobiota bacterium]
MSKIERKTQKIFAENANLNEVSIIGSLKAGNPQFSKDPKTIQSLPNYLLGLRGALIGDNSPALEDENALRYIMTYQLAYLLQQGIPEWDADTTYYKGSRVAGFDENNISRIFVSKVDDNTGNPTSDTANWGVDGNSDAEMFNTFLARSTPFIAWNNKRQITIKANTKIMLSVAGVERWAFLSQDTAINVENVLDTSSVLQNGKNYYIYLVPDGNLTKFIVSLNSTYPSGYTANNSRKIGGFHTLCASVPSTQTMLLNGQTVLHSLSGYVAGDILPQSIWCLNFRANSENEGMVYDPMTDLWVDIYLQSGTGSSTASAYGGTVTASRQYGDHAEDMFLVKKQLLSDIEFASAMDGSNQKTNIIGSVVPSPKTAGGHIDTANNRMVSRWGIEEGCGYLWQWLESNCASGRNSAYNYSMATTDPLFDAATMNSVTYDITSAKSLQTKTPIQNLQSGDKGQLYGETYALLAGGHWTAGVYCGSRARDALILRVYLYSSIGGRGRSRSRKIV